jgi:serine phosphatase RsbU (regulator of sigma subunit)
MNIFNSKYFLKSLIAVFLFTSFFHTSATELDSLLSISNSLPNDTSQINVLNDIAFIHLNKEYTNAIFYAKRALKMSQRLNYNSGEITSLTILVDANDYLGRYSEEQKLNFNLLELYTQNNDSLGISSSYNNIGIVHYYLSNYDLATEFTKKALGFYEELNDSSGISVCFNNLGNVYSDQLDYPKSLTYYLKALEIDERAEDQHGIALIKGNIGEVYTELKEYDNAYKYLVESLIIAEKIDDGYQQENMLSAIGSLLYQEKKTNEALEFFFRALTINKELNLRSEVGELYLAISKAYQQNNDYQKSLNYLQLSNEANDEIYTRENTEKIAEMNALYKIQEKENELIRQEEMSNIQAKQKIYLIIGSLVGFTLLLIIVGIFAKANIDKRKTNSKLELQKLEIETKSQNITDSIVYAKRIQGAILPSEKSIKKHLKNSFIFYKPKDIVAGDFYWLEPNSESSNILFAAADCTGHGVPGAMVSVVCNNALNRAVREFQLKEPAKILDKVTELVIETFEHSEANIKDGMDIALCNLNTKTNELQYAGANNALYLVRDNELSVIKPDKQPIGKFTNTVAFNNHKMTLKENDIIYLFTDGFADQFGGEKGKKFKYKQFKELILKNCNSTMENQLNEFNSVFNAWKGDLEQIDDICVIGVRI